MVTVFVGGPPRPDAMVVHLGRMIGARAPLPQSAPIPHLSFPHLSPMTVYLPQVRSIAMVTVLWEGRLGPMRWWRTSDG